MAEDLATWSAKNLEERGIPTKETVELYRRWGEGEWGTIATGNIDIEFDMLDGVGDGITTLECPPEGPRFEAFSEVAKTAKANGSLIIGQVTHPGRQLSSRIRKDTISASAIQLEPNAGSNTYATPREATESDISRVIDGFAHAASYLQKAGFEGIQLHGAHGYLLAQFLSETTNRRTDKYGGSLENRIRLVVEVAEAIKGCVDPGFILGIKVNSFEFQENGFTPEESKVLCETLQAHGFDYIELSSGTHEVFGMEHRKESTKKREAYFIDFIEGIVPNLTTTKKFLTGGFRTAGAMARALSLVDGIGLGRGAAQEPRLPADALAGRVTGTIKPLEVVVNDFMTHLMAAGAQIRQVSPGLARSAKDKSRSI